MSTADAVNEWFRERLACGPIARDTDAYNQAFAALPDLIARLATTDSASVAQGKVTKAPFGPVSATEPIGEPATPTAIQP